MRDSPSPILWDYSEYRAGHGAKNLLVLGSVDECVLGSDSNFNRGRPGMWETSRAILNMRGRNFFAGHSMAVKTAISLYRGTAIPGTKTQQTKIPARR
jgi:hypothetical protein